MRHGAAEVPSRQRAAACQRSLSHARQKQQKSRGPVAVSLVRAVGAHVKMFKGLEASAAARRVCCRRHLEFFLRWFKLTRRCHTGNCFGASLRYIRPKRTPDLKNGSYRGHRPLLFQRRGALLAGGGPAGPDGGPRARRRRRGAGAVPQGLHAAHVPTSVPQTALRRFYGPPAPWGTSGQEILSAGEKQLTHSS